MIFASFVALALAASVSAGPALSVALSGSQSFAGVDSASVTATLTNTGDKAVTLLNDPDTILHSVDTNTFSITTENGSKPKFVGKIVNWQPAYSKSTTTLQPGQSITVQHSLGDAYDFTSTGEAAYTIVPRKTKFTVVTESGKHEYINANVSVHEARLSGALKKERLFPTGPEKRSSFKGCSSSQQSIVNAAAPIAQNYVNGAVTYLQGHKSGTTRYTTWFGTYSDARYNRVLTNFQRLTQVHFTSNTYDCSTCTEDWLAYVYAEQPYYTYLCSAYFTLPASPQSPYYDATPGILVHEASHWTVAAGSCDCAYEMGPSKTLAKNSPDTAVGNGDNLMYFAQNVPALA